MGKPTSVFLMKKALLGLFLAVTSLAQRPLPLSLTELANAIRPPPSDVDEAYKLTMADEEGHRVLVPRLATFQQQLQQKSAEIASAAPTPSHGSRPTPEVAAAMKALTDETAAAGKALGGGELASAVASNGEETKYFETAHQQVRDEEAAAIAKAPVDKRGEAWLPDGKTVRAIQSTAWKKHLAIENERLAKHRQAWGIAATEQKAALMKIDQVLADAHYAEGAPTMYQQMLAGYQQLGLGRVSNLFRSATFDVLSAADWVQQWKDWQKNNPE